MGDVRSLVKQSPPVDVSKPFDDTTLKDKTIVITGGANGLGARFVRRWASAGAHVIIGDLDDAAGELLVAELRTVHPKSAFAFQHCDVTDWESQVCLFETAVRASPSGGVDVVVPNAGILMPGEAAKFINPQLVNGKLPKPHTATFDVNITGVAYTTHLALYHLPRNGKTDRCILLIGSLSSLVPLPGQDQYTMSKHAVAGLFRSLRGTAVFTSGVRVNMIAPFYVGQTNMLKAGTEALLLSGSAGPASIADVVDAATRLIADEAIAGRALVIGPRIQSSTVPAVQDADPRMVVAQREGDGDGRAVWECYAGDYDEVDMFVKRYLVLLNAAARVRGWMGVLRDLWIIWRRK